MRSPWFSSLIDQFFGGAFEIEMKCNEAPEEEAKQSKENFLQLSCFISQEVKYMLSGIKSVSSAHSSHYYGLMAPKSIAETSGDDYKEIRDSRA